MTAQPRSPLVIPWWCLHVLYGAFVILGILGVIFGSPTLDIANPDGLTAVWGWATAITATVAFIGSMRDRWERIERWGVIALDVVVIFYASNAVLLVLNGTRQASTAFFTGIVLLITLLPVGRGIALVLRTGLK